VCTPVEVKAVEKLLMVGEFPVDGATRKFFFSTRGSGIIPGRRAHHAFAIRFA
jgi:hypothetical protein